MAPKKKPKGKPQVKKSNATRSGFGELERKILAAKGVSADRLQALLKAGIRSLPDFRTVGDATTLAELTGLDGATACRVMAWALGAGGGAGTTTVLESGDVVNCVACGKRQPKDYNSGDLCVYCGKQAEPVFACYWCSAAGPGKYCRSCGAVFVSAGELELAILLKRDGLPKEEIPSRLSGMSAAEKDSLWGRVRARR
jgi:hypothetical protein